jgi:hypothetical protein
MTWNTKNWETRLNEVIETIGGRADAVKAAATLILDMEAKLEAIPKPAREALSESLHLNKQGIPEQRRCWRAIALIEKLYFHNPRDAGRIIPRENMIPSLSDTQRRLDLYIMAPQYFGYESQPAYGRGAAAWYAQELARNVELSRFQAITCQNSVLECMRLASANKWARASANNNELEGLFFHGNKDRSLATSFQQIWPDSVVVVYKRSGTSDAFYYAHTMICIGSNLCAGSNNGCIGGLPSFSTVDLTQYFSPITDNGISKRRRGVIPNDDASYNDVMFYARGIAEIIG